MKTCTNCGTTLYDDAKFCNACGNPADTADTGNANEQRCLDRLSTGLKHEKLCYKIYGIVSIVLAALMLFIGIITMAVGSIGLYNYTDYDTNVYVQDYYSDGNYYYYDYDGEYYFDDDVAYTAAGVAIFAFGGFYIGLGVVLLAVAIVNLVLNSKIGKYRSNLYTDCTNGANHAGSVGSIVLAAFFNEIALIFVIINFVFMKNNKATFEKIKANQQRFNAQQ